MTVTTTRDAQLGRLAGGAGLTAVGGVVTGVAGFAVMALVAGALGASAAGVFGIGVSVSMIATQVGKLGCDTALVHFIPRWSQAEGGADVRGVLLRVLATVALLGVVTGSLAWMAAPALGTALLGGVDPEQATTAMRMVALGLPPAALSAVALAGTRGYGAIRPLVLNDQVAKPTLRLVLVLVVLAAQGDVTAVLTAWALAQWCVLPAALVALRRIVRTRLPARSKPVQAQPFVRYAGLRLLSASVEIVGLHAGMLAVGVLLGTAEAGVYAVATRLVLAGYLTLQAVRLAVAPQLSAALGERDLVLAQRLHQASSAWVILTAWPAYLVLAVLAPTVLGVFGPEFVSGAAVLSIVAVGGMVSTGAGNIQTVLLMGGHAGVYLTVAVASVATNLGLLGLLVPGWGVIGAALAFLGAAVVENGLTLVAAGRLLGVRHVGRPVLTAAALATATVGSGALAARLLGVGLAAQILVLAAVSLLFLECCRRLRAPLHLEGLLSTMRRRSDDDHL